MQFCKTKSRLGTVFSFDLSRDFVIHLVIFSFISFSIFKYQTSNYICDNYNYKVIKSWIQTANYPLDTKSKLNVHMMLRRRLGRSTYI